MKTICMAGWALTAILATTPARGVTDRTAVVRERVLGFAKANLGRKVGNGECAALAFQALRAAGAKPRAAHGFPTPRDYVWGKLVLLADATPQGLRMTGALNDVRPGDIAQFSNARLGRKHFAHHTAIVADIKAQMSGSWSKKSRAGGLSSREESLWKGFLPGGSDSTVRFPFTRSYERRFESLASLLARDR